MEPKEFKTHNQQLKLLRSRGLNVPTNGTPKRILEKENYYNIINGYKDLFLETDSDIEIYKKDARFSEIKALYDFDFELKAIILKCILKVENEMKSLISYAFSEKYGHNNYMKIENFNMNRNNPKSISNVMALITGVQNIISKQVTKHESIKHYMMEYGYVPFWVLVNILPLGTLSKFYTFMKQSDKQSISKVYNLSDADLENILKNLTYCRNKCAHGERLYNFKSTAAIRINRVHKELGINKSHECGYNDLFSIIISLKLLLNKRDFNKLIDDIGREIKHLDKNLHVIEITDVYKKMGFINNWIDLKNS